MKKFVHLTPKSAETLQSLLAQHAEAVTALSVVGKYDRTISLSDDKTNDFANVSLNYDICKRAIVSQKEWIEKEMKKLGVSLGRNGIVPAVSP